jgi:CBS-domain-containing membrane protein
LNDKVSIIKKEDYDTIFTTFSEILDLNRDFLERLKLRIEEGKKLVKKKTRIKKNRL